MTPEQLRASILQQAMEGKLVKQKYKEKIDQSMPFKRSDLIPYKIPENWNWVILGSVASFLNGRAYKKSELLDDNKLTPVLRVGNLFTNSKWYYSDLKLDSNKYIDKGDLIYAWSASFGPRIWQGGHVIYHYHIWKVNFNKSLVDKKFLEYFLSDERNVLGETKVHGSTMKHITKTNMEHLPFPLPPLTEQKRIVAKLDQLMPLVDEYAEAYDKLKKLDDGFNDKLKQSLLQYAMEGKLVKQDPNDEPASVLLEKIAEEKARLIKEKKIKRTKKLPEITDDEKPFEIPDSWEWVRLGEIGAITSGGTPKTTEKSYWEKAKIPWITPAVMSSQINGIVFQNTEIKYINKNGLEHSSAQLIPAYSIVVSSRAPIGYVNIVPYEYTTNQGCKSVTTFSNVNKEFIYYTIKYSVPDMYKRASGTTFKEISGTKFGQTIIPLPPLAEQKRIVAKLDQLMSIMH
ncbi:restriction endonuclease subunit S [Limosilactobacillus reuteri subsp. suis]|uniref:restriction endonuclease subunit S n=1 Tax=Limosilactobacillus reuteri TaxID=1598 RepID=UPI003992CCD1